MEGEIVSERFKQINDFEIDDTSNNYRPMGCASSLDADVICTLLNNQDKMIKSLKDLITSNCVGEEETLDGYEKVYTITDSELQDCLKEFSR